MAKLELSLNLDVCQNPKTYPKTKIFAGNILPSLKVEAKVGSFIKADGWKTGERLLPSDWDKADFYSPTGFSVGVLQVATNVYISGRKLLYKDGNKWVRIQIEFVGDGEPSSFTYGWMLIDEFNMVAI